MATRVTLRTYQIRPGTGAPTGMWEWTLDGAPDDDDGCEDWFDTQLEAAEAAIEHAANRGYTTSLGRLIADVKAETIERCALRVEEHNDDELCGWWFAEHIRTMKP